MRTPRLDALSIGRFQESRLEIALNQLFQELGYTSQQIQDWADREGDLQKQMRSVYERPRNLDKFESPEYQALVQKRESLLEEPQIEGKLPQIKEWFEQHPENLVSSVQELVYLCLLPNPLRRAVTYPTIGNLSMAIIRQIETPFQDIIVQINGHQRFFNNHWREESSDDEKDNNSPTISRYSLLIDQLYKALLTQKDEGIKLATEIGKIAAGVSNIYQAIPESPIFLSDFGHGLGAPFDYFSHDLFWRFRHIIQNSPAVETEYKILLVEDTEPQKWFERLTQLGFSGKYCQSSSEALAELETKKYDLILSDIDLGEGQPDGIQLALQVHQLPEAQRPMIFLFSYNDNLKKRAEEVDETRRVIKRTYSKKDFMVVNLLYDFLARY